jgi:hypothetical protein
MSYRNPLILRTSALLVLLMALAVPAVAQSVASRQTLDRVYAYDAQSILNMATGNANPAQDFDLTGITGTNFVTCTLSVVSGLYCLDGTVVRNWPDPLKPAVFNDPVSCSDPALGLDLSKGNPCTAMTVDLNNTIWIAARKRNTHSVYKIIANPGSCPATWLTISSGARCAKEMYFGRPPLVDLIAVDGDVAKNFKPCPSCATGQTGVIGIEERKATVFYPDPQAAQPIVVVESKGWGLSGNELLQDITLLQLPNNAQVIETTLLATTTKGRIVARNTSQSLAGRPVFNIPAERIPGSLKCNSLEQQYGMRASATTSIVYVSDRNYCQVLALEPDAGFTKLDNVRVGVSPNDHDLTLSTSDTRGMFGVIGLTVAPGIGIDLSDCVPTGPVVSATCTLINSKDGTPAATLTDVHLVEGSATGATIFQIKDIPDCRYAQFFPNNSAGNAKRAVCATPPATTPNLVIDSSGNGVIVNADGSLASGNPAAMRLNVTPLLPDVVVKAFKASGLRADGLLPPLLISRQYRARTSYLFEALFVLPKPGVLYAGTFLSEFKVPELEGTASRVYCINGQSGNPTTWDIATRVSELYADVDGKYVDALTNVGCNSIRGGLQGMSLLPYDLQVNPDTWGKKYVSSPGHESSSPGLTTNNDAVFARLVQSLVEDLGRVQQAQVCTPGLLTTYVCSTLTERLSDAKHELKECVDQSFLPSSPYYLRHPEGYDDCQESIERLQQFKAALPAQPVAGDVANRLGELKVRVDVILHVFRDRFLPSVPAGGFCRENLNCPVVWQP